MAQMESLDDEVDIIKRKLLKSCHSTTFSYNKGEGKTVLTEREKVRNAFWESIAIWKKIDESEKKGVYSRAFYFSHLYIRLVLAEKLHRRTENDLKNISEKTLERLKIIESRLTAQLDGIRRQVKYKLDIEAERRIKADQKREQEEREQMRIKEMEANKIPNVVPGIAPTIATVPVVTDPTSVGPSPLPSQDVFSPGVPVVPQPSIHPTPSYPTLDPNEDIASIPKPVIRPAPVLPPASVQPAAVVTDNKPSPAPTPTPQVTVVDPYENLASSAWRKKIVAGDGNCAFRSVAQGVARGSLPKEKETAEATRLRKEVCKQLWVKRDKDIKGLGLTVEQLVTIDPDGKHDSFRAYLNGMAKGDYAGEVELILMGQSIGRPIFVYQPTGLGYKRIARYDVGGGEPVCLVWQKGITEGGNHYNVLIRN